MLSRRRLVALVSGFAVICSINVSAQRGGRGGQQTPGDANSRKLSDAQKREIQASIKIVDDAMAGQAMTNDLSLSWVRQDILKATDEKEYVPFIVSIDPAKVAAGATIYWRVVNKNAPPPAPPAPVDEKDKKDKKDDKNKPAPRPVYAYEDISVDAVAPGVAAAAGGRISRSFTVPTGDYDVYVVVKEPTSDKKNAPPPKVSMIKQTLSVPDFWNGELNTSSVIVAERIDPLPAPLTPQQQIERPYALGAMELVPTSETKFTKKSELQPFLLIYNPKTDAANKPDITVEFTFFAKDASGEKPFNHTAPQNLNASTLPPQFDFALGHQLQTGEAIPLASFPEGSYRLEIKVTDKLANKTITRDINFSVAGS
jgi:hypothetical protein